MKKITVILPIYNPEMLTQADLDAYQTTDCCFELCYADTKLKELNTQADADAVLPSVLEKMVAAEKNFA